MNPVPFFGRRKQGRQPFFVYSVYFLVIFLALSPINSFADEDGHDHDTPHDREPGKTEGPRPPSKVGQCGAAPSQLLEIANGESQAMGPVVSYLTTPSCIEAAPQIRKEILSLVTFKETGPYVLKPFAKIVMENSDFPTLQRVDSDLETRMRSLLRTNPLTPKELIPLTSQLALLSPSAGKIALANLVEQQLYAADMTLSKSSSSVGLAKKLAGLLTELGATESPIISELSDNVEEMAVMVQADSLRKIFQGLALASGVAPTLSGAFNLSAGALNRGVQKSNKVYGEEEKTSMLQSVFASLQASLRAGSLLEPGRTELNEALNALLKNKSLADTALKSSWRKAVQVLAQSVSQTALAQAVALSLTPEFIFLQKEDLTALFQAGSHYPEIATAIQANLFGVWDNANKSLQQGKIDVRVFNKIREQYLEPLVANVLDLPPEFVNPFWLSEIVKRGLVSDETIEKRFPRMVLAAVERSDRASRELASHEALDTAISSLAESLGTVWTLSRVHVPALMKWIQKFDAAQKKKEQPE